MTYLVRLRFRSRTRLPVALTPMQGSSRHWVPCQTWMLGPYPYWVKLLRCLTATHLVDRSWLVARSLTDLLVRLLAVQCSAPETPTTRAHPILSVLVETGPRHAGVRWKRSASTLATTLFMGLMVNSSPLAGRTT